MGNSLGEAFGCLVIILILGAITIVGFSPLFNKQFNLSSSTIESKSIIKPDYRLESSGKKVDTIYIYTFKNK